MLPALLILLLVVLGSAAGVLLWRRRAHAASRARLEAPVSALAQLRQGDHLSYLHTTYRVSARRERQAGSQRWLELTLRDHARTYWLCVELGGPGRVALCDALALEGLPAAPPATIVHDGITYHRETAEDHEPAGPAGVFTYTAPDGGWLFVDPGLPAPGQEAGGGPGSWEEGPRVRVGREVEPAAFVRL